VKKYLAAIAIISLLATVSSAEWVGKKDLQSRFNLLKSLPDRTVMEIIPGSFDVKSIDIEGVEYSVIDLPGSGPLLDKGYPELPVLAQSLIVPDAGGWN